MIISLSKLDTERFGIQSARASGIKHDDILDVLTYCKANSVRFLIARCNAADIATVQEMESAGFRLMDTQVCYVHNLKSIQKDKREDNIIIRELDPATETRLVEKISAIGFKNYNGHYHNDTMLNIDECNRTYEDWGYRVCHDKLAADKVFVAEDKGKIVGFVAVRLNNDKDGEGVLSSILPEYQGKGIYRSLIIEALNWIAGQKKERMIVSTQITSIAVQKVWVRLGFEPSIDNAFYTFHKHFERY
ncbi:MAG: GNAT family N-acetyltransferase [Planctomycetota bacterium]